MKENIRDGTQEISQLRSTAKPGTNRRSNKEQLQQINLGLVSRKITEGERWGCGVGWGINQFLFV